MHLQMYITTAVTCSISCDYVVLSLSKNLCNSLAQHHFTTTVEFGYNVMKGTEYFMSLLTSVVITE